MGPSLSRKQRESLGESDQRTAPRLTARERNEQLWRNSSGPKGGMGGSYSRTQGSTYKSGYTITHVPRGGFGGSYGGMSSRGNSPRASSVGARTPRGGCGGEYRWQGDSRPGSRYGSAYGGSVRAFSVGAPTPRGGCGGDYRGQGDSRPGSRYGSAYGGSRPSSVREEIS
ncbi:hypothetical protein Q4I30_000666 [Leishmania utingensis]|uniref:Uncharacterized protein n=1 Tax=Leishmania utingensis TaxID=653362 RepID=A0AAW3B3P4_9TRYP